jgi:hypothetical protein
MKPPDQHEGFEAVHAEMAQSVLVAWRRDTRGYRCLLLLLVCGLFRCYCTRGICGGVSYCYGYSFPAQLVW